MKGVHNIVDLRPQPYWPKGRWTTTLWSIMTLRNRKRSANTWNWLFIAWMVENKARLLGAALQSHEWVDQRMIHRIVNPSSPSPFKKMFKNTQWRPQIYFNYCTLHAILNGFSVCSIFICQLFVCSHAWLGAMIQWPSRRFWACTELLFTLQRDEAALKKSNYLWVSTKPCLSADDTSMSTSGCRNVEKGTTIIS